eukprot:4901149-Pyramimonas_sp.AAC.1
MALLWLVCAMLGGAGQQCGGSGRVGNMRQPPAWYRHRESDLLAWGVLATDMDSAQQRASIFLNFGMAFLVKSRAP